MALIVPAFAKLNLTLDVLSRRPDGYHEIDSVMQTISLHDVLWIERTDCRVFDVVGPTIEGTNLVIKAARELEGAVSRQLPFTIRLWKRIPIGAGLGGGSADAAALLKAANQLYGLKLKTAELAEIATQVGQDVPFFLQGGTVRATGLGSTLSSLPAVPTGWRILVVCPPLQISTKTVYEAVDGHTPSARRTAGLIDHLAPLPDPPPAQQGEGVVGDVARLFANDLEPVTRRLFPAYNEALERARELVPSLTMTGTGAGLFAVFPDRPQAADAFNRIEPLGYPMWITHPVPGTN
ncbi:MAG TPA: 4-(cytidine 5'-diphospho)-2-C-methyl-D-erythritol kinase [Candidatus Dormibacteraeota bacterium]